MCRLKVRPCRMGWAPHPSGTTSTTSTTSITASRSSIFQKIISMKRYEQNFPFSIIFLYSLFHNILSNSCVCLHWISEIMKYSTYSEKKLFLFLLNLIIFFFYSRSCVIRFWTFFYKISKSTIPVGDFFHIHFFFYHKGRNTTVKSNYIGWDGFFYFYV